MLSEHDWALSKYIECIVQFSILTRYNRQFSNIIEYEVKTPNRVYQLKIVCFFGFPVEL